MIAQHIVDALRERRATAGDEDEPFDDTQIVYAVADGFARAGMTAEALYVTQAADRLAAGGG